MMMNIQKKKSILISVTAIIFVVAVSIVVLKMDNKGPNELPIEKSVQSDVTTSSGKAVQVVSSESSNFPKDQPSPTFIPGTKFVPEGLTVKDDTLVFDSRSVDINDDSSEDDVVLIGEKQDNNSPFVQNIRVVVKDGKTEKYSLASIGDFNAGYEPKLFIGCFTGERNQDIFISLATGGSGGIYQYSLLSFKNNQLSPIIPQKELNRGLEFQTKCLPGFILKVADKNTTYTATIDLHKGLAEYKRLGIYNDQGDVLKDPSVLVDGFGVLKPEDINGDGIYELNGIQRISVGYHANSIANAESVWTVCNGQLQLFSEIVEPLK